MIENRISDRAKILLIDEDTSISYLIRRAMEKENYKIYIAGSGKQGMEMSTGVCPDLILMDNKFSDMEGITLIQWFREWTDCPIIILSERSSYLDKVEALYAGADDYMVKPFSIKELLVRVAALLRRVKKEESSMKLNKIVSEPFELDLDKRKLFKDGREIELTPTEFSIVKYLMVNAKQSLSRDQILTEVWGNNYLYDFKIVDVNIRRIRNKIEDDPSKPKYIQTIWGYGYCFRKED